MGSADSPPLLEVTDLVAGYLDHDILHGVSLRVNAGEIVCVIGPNGAGKSTVFRAIYGLIRPRRGRVTFDGREITGKKPQAVLREGIAIVPQLRSVFPQMTVHENLELGLYLERDSALIARRIDEVYRMFPRLAERRSQHAGTMSGGEQRMLEIGRSLLPSPRLVLMDEPSVGLAPKVADEIFATMGRLNRELGLSVLMIEQNARKGLAASHRGYVLELGKNRFEGSAQALLEDPEVRRAFLGGRAPASS